MNTGRAIQGHPSLGAWISYGLGELNENLPAYVVMLDPRGGPTTGSPNWSHGYMPASLQGTVLRTQGPPIMNLTPARGTAQSTQRHQIELTQHFNRFHLENRDHASWLEARIRSYELAFRLQMTAPEALDIESESPTLREQYGIGADKGSHRLCLGPDPFGRQCLVARRLVERGVRLSKRLRGCSWRTNSWTRTRKTGNSRPEIDRSHFSTPEDLEQRAGFEETLVVWGGEFGRQPVSETFNTGGKSGGRDHNPLGLTYWMAGGGIQPGVRYGSTDELGERAVEHPHHPGPPRYHSPPDGIDWY